MGTHCRQMYSLKPIVNLSPIELPKVMYSLKPIVTHGPVTTVSGEMAIDENPVPTRSTPNKNKGKGQGKDVPAKKDDGEIEALLERQEKILSSIKELQDRVQKVTAKVPVNIKTAGRTGNVIKLELGQAPLVVTVWADPLDPPFSLLSLLPLLEKDFKVHCSVHRHSSVSSLPDSPFVKALNNLLPHPSDHRMGVQLSIMLIWKLGSGTRMLVSPIQQFPVESEPTIVSYLAHIIPNLSPQKESPERATLIDHLMDDAYMGLCWGSAKEKQVYLRSLNGRLGTSSGFLLGDKITLADIYISSLLLKSCAISEIPANVKKWLKSFFSQPQMNLLVSHPDLKALFNAL
ncbi:unnamed protein product [Darwinula stevensoni]|uniref:Aminoacyl tRNA synthase complex-interacting multifunctional protein 2 n=1 Tax=Darwinula stevensoni TaxID=69355 RepID=A0A7R8XH20_9CRUS|nr:unnamed protein product [Darwinula stevensoni]CAG0892308.1 unnamed protein product [Darwinula stevensoni]